MTLIGWPPAVEATTCATTGACVFGINAASGPGVLGKSAGADGVDGKTSFAGTAIRAASGVAGLDLSVSSYNFGVFGNSKNGQGVHGSSMTGTGVFGGAASGVGVHGMSRTSAGVLGESTNVYGSATNTTGGVVGRSSLNFGVVGMSDLQAGVLGVSTEGVGVEAQTQSGTALIAAGFGNNATAVLGESFGANGDAVEAFAEGYESGNGLTASAQAHGYYGASIVNSLGTGTYIGGGTIGADIESAGIGIVGRSPSGRKFQPLLLTDLNGVQLFYVDGDGDVYYRGTIQKFAATGGGTTVNTYTAASTTPSLEDVGSARLVDGRADVKLDTAFARAIDLQNPYHVFLSPNGDTRGLYVFSKSASGFIVRETQGGRGTLTFDYRIVAASLGHGADRMTLMSAAEVAARVPHSQREDPRVERPNLPKRFRMLAGAPQ